MTYTHFHRGEVVVYEDKCPDIECAEPEPVSPEVAEQLYDAIVNGTPVVVYADDDALEDQGWHANG